MSSHGIYFTENVHISFYVCDIPNPRSISTLTQETLHYLGNRLMVDGHLYACWAWAVTSLERFIGANGGTLEAFADFARRFTSRGWAFALL